MKGLPYALKITVFVLNSIFLAGILFGMSMYGDSLLSNWD